MSIKACLAAALLIFTVQGAAAATVKVIGEGAGWATPVELNLTELKRHSRSVQTVDPNFATDGSQTFTGTPLAKILELAGLQGNRELTVVGADQYVGLVPPDRLAAGILAWEAGGQPISPLKGGPLKIIFPEDAGIHASCFTWYVEALVQGRPAGEPLAVTVNGAEKRYGRPELIAMSGPLPSRMASITQGCRNAAGESVADQPLKVVHLSQLTGSLSDQALTTVELIPHFGPVVRLKADAMLGDAHIVVGWGAFTLHPAFGGPYSIVFPVEEHPALQDLVPESGAYFFLKAIVVN